MLRHVWLVHPEESMCAAFRRRFADLPNVRIVETAAFPAMGTGFGGVPFDEAARQMAAAWRHYLLPPHRVDWDFVASRQKAIHYDGDRQVVK